MIYSRDIGAGGHGTVFSMWFYADISWKSRCNSEIKVWGHLCQILVFFEVPNYQNLTKVSNVFVLEFRLCVYCIFASKTTSPLVITHVTNWKKLWHVIIRFYIIQKLYRVRFKFSYTLNVNLWLVCKFYVDWKVKFSPIECPVYQWQPPKCIFGGCQW